MHEEDNVTISSPSGRRRRRRDGGRGGEGVTVGRDEGPGFGRFALMSGQSETPPPPLGGRAVGFEGASSFDAAIIRVNENGSQRRFREFAGTEKKPGESYRGRHS